MTEPLDQVEHVGPRTRRRKCSTALAVTLGYGQPAPRDVATLAAAYLRHALTAPSWPPMAPTSRELRAALRGWSRQRFADAWRSLAPRLITREDGGRTLTVEVPGGAGPAGKLLASAPSPLRRRDCGYLRVYLAADGWPDHRQLLADLDGLGVASGYSRLKVDLGEATAPHPWFICSLVGAVRAGRIPAPEFHGPDYAVMEAWRLAYERRERCGSPTPN